MVYAYIPVWYTWTCLVSTNAYKNTCTCIILLYLYYEPIQTWTSVLQINGLLSKNCNYTQILLVMTCFTCKKMAQTWNFLADD